MNRLQQYYQEKIIPKLKKELKINNELAIPKLKKIIINMGIGDAYKDKSMLDQPTDTKCEKCGKPMVIKHGRFGKFLACTGFPECKNTKNIKEEPTEIGMQCPECHQGDIVVRKTRKGRTFYGCARYPDCKYASWDNPKEKQVKKADQ